MLVGAARAAPLVFLVHYRVSAAGIRVLCGVEMGMLFHAMTSVIRGEGDARDSLPSPIEKYPNGIRNCWKE